MCQLCLGFLSHVCCDVVTVWWVVPCDVSFSLAFVVCGVVWCGVCVFVCWIVFQLVVVSAFLECVLVLYSP